MLSTPPQAAPARAVTTRALTWEDPAPAASEPALPLAQPRPRPDGTRPLVFFSCSCKLSEFMDRAREAQNNLPPAC